MQTHNESSVLFNLQELMRIEHDRVEAEHAAARALEEQARQRQREQAAAVERAQIEEQAAENARQRAQIEEAARLEVARAVALERARLSVEAAERAERQRMAQQHAEALARLTRSTRLPWRQGVWVLAVVCAIVALGYFGAIDPMLRQSRALEAQARALADHYAREIDALRQTPIVVAQPLVSAEAPVPATPAVHVTKPPIAKAKRVRPTPRAKVDPRTGNEALIDPLDAEDDDPLKGL